MTNFPSRTGDDRFAAFDIVLKRRGRGRWKWSVCAAGGETVLCGSESSRPSVRYKAQSALFLLLCASASRIPALRPATASEISGASARRPQSRITIEGLRQQRKSSENIVRPRSAHAATAASKAMARRLVRRPPRSSGGMGASEL